MSPESDFRADEAWALTQDANDPLAAFRNEFLIPPHDNREQVAAGTLAGGQQIYLCGNSLGLQPRATRQALIDELDDWGKLAVEAHFRGKHPWMPYHAFVRDPLAELVGAEPAEVVAMNSLSVNLHLMMVSFYRPTRERPAILIEKSAFPSDRYAVESQIRFHGFDPATDLIELVGDEANGSLSESAIARALDEHGSRIALVLLPGVQYLTGQAFDLKRITELAQRKGCVVGFDLAHAAGNLPLNLHDSGCDFAVWCSYKYLNSGPGAVAGCFVHARHATRHCRVSPAGGAMTRRRVSRWVRSSCRRPAPTAGNCRIRRSLRWRRCACRWTSSTALAWLACAKNRVDADRLSGIGWSATQLATRCGHRHPARTANAAAASSRLRVQRQSRDAGRALFEHLAARGVDRRLARTGHDPHRTHATV